MAADTPVELWDGDLHVHVDDPKTHAERAARQDMAASDGDPYEILGKRELID